MIQALAAQLLQRMLLQVMMNHEWEKTKGRTFCCLGKRKKNQ